jgi:hypothetical protein
MTAVGETIPQGEEEFTLTGSRVAADRAVRASAAAGVVLVAGTAVAGWGWVVAVIWAAWAALTAIAVRGAAD